MEQGVLFVEEMSVGVIEGTLTCRRCGKQTKKMIVAEGFLEKLYVICGRCKRMSEDGEARLERHLPLIKKANLFATAYSPVKAVETEEVVICRTREELYSVNQRGLVGVLHPKASL